MTIRRGKGFSILELMVTLAVLAVLIAIAVPSFRGTMRRARVSGAVNTMVGDLQFSRSEAATRRQFVSICRSMDGATCALDASNYDVGYLVYAYDASATGPNQLYDASKHTLLRTTPSTTGVSIQATDANVVTFGQTGLPVANASRVSMQFVFCGRAPGVSSGAGVNNTESPGARLSLGVSGSLVNTKLSSTATCTPTG